MCPCQGEKDINDFKFGAFIGRFKSDNAASMAVKGLNHSWAKSTSPKRSSKGKNTHSLETCRLHNYTDFKLNTSCQAHDSNSTVNHRPLPKPEAKSLFTGPCYLATKEYHKGGN